MTNKDKMIRSSIRNSSTDAMRGLGILEVVKRKIIEACIAAQRHYEKGLKKKPTHRKCATGYDEKPKSQPYYQRSRSGKMNRY